MRFKVFAVVAFVPFWLMACGGGSGGGTTAPVTPLPAWTVTPAAMTAAPDVTLPSSAVFTAASNVFQDPVYIQAVDPQNVVYLLQSSRRVDGGGYQLTLATSKRLAVGRYTGSVELRFCPVSDCAQQHPGSPQRVPYDITVVNPYQTPPLSRIPGLPDWETHQGNAAHTGYVPVSLDAAKFTTRWRWQRFDGRSMGAPVVANDKVFVTTANAFLHHTLQAIKEADGTLAWEYANYFLTTAPAVSNGAVYFAKASSFSDGFLWAINASDGSLRFRTAGSTSQAATGGQAPTIMAGRVYVNSALDGASAATGGTQSFDATTGSLAWARSWDDAYRFQAGTPALDAQFSYTVWESFQGNQRSRKVYALDAATGAIAKVTDLGGVGPTSDPVPVLASNGRLLVSDGQTLRLVQPLSGSILWTLETSSYAVEPVVAGDTVFVANGLRKQLEARNLNTGDLLWAWPIDAALDQFFFSNMVVTDSHVFVSTRRATYAIDRNTHRPAAWSYPMAGAKAISANGILYIATAADTLPGFNPINDGGLTAINLR
ncbi:MAG: PQQ-binding-like beta-propeller repeat protein [Pseudomonadota bacterium]